MARGRILFLCLPVVAAVVAARFVIHELALFDSGVAFDDVGVVVTGSSLIMGLMVVAVHGEYAEAARLPGSVATAISALDGLAVSAGAAAGFAPTAPRRKVAGIAGSIMDWLGGQISDAQIRAAIDDLRRIVVELEKAGASGHYLVRAHAELGTIDSGVKRMMALRNTSYLQSGFTLMDVLVGLAVVLLLVVEHGDAGTAQWVVTGTLTLIFSYLVILARDLDNPFSYGRRRGAAEVSLAPLVDVRVELGNAADAPQPNAAAVASRG